MNVLSGQEKKHFYYNDTFFSTEKKNRGNWCSFFFINKILAKLQGVLTKIVFYPTQVAL